MKYQYRITKYNPKYRDKNSGKYLLDEWTSIDDIGNKFNNKTLTKEEYLLIEDFYIKIIIAFMEESNITQLQLIDYENNSDFKIFNIKIYNNKFLTKEEIELVARHILREDFWGRLICDKNMFVHFGYDYYMYIGVDKDSTKSLNITQDLGLFAEVFDSPYNE